VKARRLAEDPRSSGEVVSEPHYIVQDVHRRVGLPHHKNIQNNDKKRLNAKLDVMLNETQSPMGQKAFSN